MALQEVFIKCKLDSYGGYSKTTALSFFKVPDENWFVGLWNRGQI